ncbi:hypothetical protein ACQY0O_005903 [Thecaphora frezii]|nr:hypothetical protein [Thecaphora frezii]
MSTFTPNPNFDPETSNPKDWAYQLGCLPQTHHIVFTKADLINFLKQHNVHVGPNFTELAKLPKYASIGKLSDTAGASEAPSQSAAAQEASSSSPHPATAAKEAGSAKVVYTSSGEVFRPTRKVRELPGGGSAQITSLFSGGQDQDEEQIRPAAPAARELGKEAENIPPPRSTASSRRNNAVGQSQVFGAAPEEAIAPVGKYEGVPVNITTNNGFRPTRRVRVPGGTGGVSNITFE